MPGRDRTGPLGRGAMSGWGYGNCTGSHVGEAAGPRPWRGLGMNVRSSGWSRKDFGGRCRSRPYAGSGRPVRMRAMGWSRQDRVLPDDRPIDKKTLKRRMRALQSELETIDKQLNELEADTEKEGTENDPL